MCSSFCSLGLVLLISNMKVVMNSSGMTASSRSGEYISHVSDGMVYSRYWSCDEVNLMLIWPTSQSWHNMSRKKFEHLNFDYFLTVRGCFIWRLSSGQAFFRIAVGGFNCNSKQTSINCGFVCHNVIVKYSDVCYNTATWWQNQINNRSEQLILNSTKNWMIHIKNLELQKNLKLRW